MDVGGETEEAGQGQTILLSFTYGETDNIQFVGFCIKYTKFDDVRNYVSLLYYRQKNKQE